MNRDTFKRISVQTVLPVRAYGFGKISQLLLRIAEVLTHKVFYAIPPDSITDLTETPHTLLKPLRAATILQKANIIQRIHRGYRKWPDIPHMIKFGVTAPRKGNNTGFGESFFSEEEALWRAIAECTERQLWREYDFYSQNSIRLPVAQMRRATLDIFSLAGFSETQKKEQKRLQFTAETPFLWTRGYSLTHKKPLYIPTQLVSARYSYKNSNHPMHTDISPEREPMLRWCVTTGLATGVSYYDALVSGILEVIERDAFMILHLNKLHMPRIDLRHLAETDPELDALIHTFDAYALELHVITLPTDFAVYAYAGVIRDRSGAGPAIVIGASADTNMRSAIIDALSEAFAVYHATRLHVGKEIDRNDPTQFDQEGRLIYWANPNNVSGLDYLFAGPIEKHSYPKERMEDTAYERHSKKDLRKLTSELKDKNLEAGYVDLTSPEARKAGISIVNVVIPKLIPLHLHEILPYQGGARITSVPEALGYRPANTINTDPHPFP